MFETLRAEMQDSFTTQEVIRLTGITARQLQWWDERRIVVPGREGRRRIYSFADVTTLSGLVGLTTMFDSFCGL